MNKLELATQLQNIEQRKAHFETQLRAVDSFYFKSGTLSLHIETQDFKDKGTDEAIEFTTALFVEYLKREISHLSKESKRIVTELQQ